MGYIEQTEKEIREAYIFLREKNMSIPSDTLQFMLDASLEKLNENSRKFGLADTSKNCLHWELKTKEILQKFTDGESKYKESALFHRVIEMLVRNQDPFDIIEKLLDMNADLLAKYLDYVQRDTRPMIISGQCSDRLVTIITCSNCKHFGSGANKYPCNDCVQDIHFKLKS